MLLDVSMPGRDGLAALPLVLERLPDHPGRDVQRLRRGGSGRPHPRAGRERLRREVGAAGRARRPARGDRGRRTTRGAAVRRPRRDPGAPAAAAGSSTRCSPTTSNASGRSSRTRRSAWPRITLDGRMVRVNRHLAALLRRTTAERARRRRRTPTSRPRPTTLRSHLERVRVGRRRLCELEHGLSRSPDDLGPRRRVSPVLDAGGAPALLLPPGAGHQRPAGRGGASSRQTEQRFRLLVEAVQDYAIFMLDPDGHIASWNAGAAAQQGLHRRRDHRPALPGLLPAGEAGRAAPRARARDRPCARAATRRRAGGSARTAARFWAHVTITAVHDGDGRPGRLRQGHPRRHRAAPAGAAAGGGCQGARRGQPLPGAGERPAAPGGRRAGRLPRRDGARAAVAHRGAGRVRGHARPAPRAPDVGGARGPGRGHAAQHEPAASAAQRPAHRQPCRRRHPAAAPVAVRGRRAAARGWSIAARQAWPEHRRSSSRRRARPRVLVDPGRFGRCSTT